MRGCKQSRYDRRRGHTTGSVAPQRNEDGHGADAETSDPVPVFVVETPSSPVWVGVSGWALIVEATARSLDLYPYIRLPCMIIQTPNVYLIYRSALLGVSRETSLP